MSDKTFKLKVDSDKCIGCATCTSIYPIHFKMNSEGKSEPTNNAMVSKEEAEEIVKVCPVGAICFAEKKDE